MQSKKESIEHLKQLGFNQLEAEVYLYLLSNEPMTAYKVGKAINKPTANVYKAIDLLAEKGAVLIESNKNKNCRAIKPTEFLKHYKNNIIEKTVRLESLLNNIDDNFYDEKTYSINSAPLVFERFRSMMEKAKVVAVIDIFPDALKKVLKSINNTIQRGVKVYIQVYEPLEIHGAEITCTEFGDKTLTHWQSQQINLVIDGEEYLIGLLNNEMNEVIQATWSNNYYMACMLYAGRIHEQTVVKLQALINNDDFEKEAKELLNNQQFFINSNIPGFNKLKNTK